MISDRLFLPFDRGLIDPPAEGSVLVRAKARPRYSEWPDAVAVQGFAPIAKELESFGVKVQQDMPASAPLAVVEITRSKAESLGLIAQAYACLSLGGVLIVDGNKTDGIDSIYKMLGKALPDVDVLSKSHGRVIWCVKTQKIPDIFRAWAAGLDPVKGPDGFMRQAGMFSAEGVDHGSAFLVEHLPVLKGTGADFGAGWGYLARSVLAASADIEALDLIEAEATALNMARLNVDDTRAQFIWGDATAHKGTYDFVVMNPPFHSDRKPDPALGQAFIRAAAGALLPNGHLWMVANRQLAYEAVLSECFTRVEEVATNGVFKIIHGMKPSRRR